MGPFELTLATVRVLVVIEMVVALAAFRAKHGGMVASVSGREYAQPLVSKIAADVAVCEKQPMALAGRIDLAAQHGMAVVRTFAGFCLRVVAGERKHGYLVFYQSGLVNCNCQAVCQNHQGKLHERTPW